MFLQIKVDGNNNMVREHMDKVLIKKINIMVCLLQQTSLHKILNTILKNSIHNR